MYQLINVGGEPRSDLILRTADNAYIPNDEANSDWREYQDWLAADPENNVPIPADPENQPLPAE